MEDGGGRTPGTAAQETDAVRTSSQQSGIDGAQRLAVVRQRLHVAVPGRHYEPGVNLTRPALSQPYRRDPYKDPLYRPLQIYTRDPVRSSYEGGIAVVSVPYEPLRPGPVGSRFEVVADPSQAYTKPLDLEEHGVLMSQGLPPAPGDLRFHGQMVYAVASMVSASFAVALGREPSWGFARRPNGTPDRLRLCPHFAGVRNAFYDKESGELRFGWFQADKDLGPGAAIPPGGRVYACLSHDIIAHEMAHALLDGMRSRFAEPTNPDVLAFHEAFADIVAVLQQFSYRAGVLEALRCGGGRLDRGGVIFALAEQFGRATGHGGALRTWLDQRGEPARYDPSAEPHALGAVLVGAVLDALARVFDRRVSRLRGLYALAGLPRGHLHPDYLDLLAEGATKVASQFLTLCIRAIDYCPPVDITFGEYLRALVTADRDLVEDDPLGYREALIAAFGRRSIFPPEVPDLSESSLSWRPPSVKLPKVEALDMTNLQLPPDPGFAPPVAEIERQAGALADLVTDPAYAAEFGLEVGGKGPLPVIESVRTIRRVGPDRQVRFGLVAEVVQVRHLRRRGRNVDFYGGSTVILGGAGEVRYVIRKRIDDEKRVGRLIDFVNTPAGQQAVRAAADGRTWLAIHEHQPTLAV